MLAPGIDSVYGRSVGGGERDDAAVRRRAKGSVKLWRDAAKGIEVHEIEDALAQQRAAVARMHGLNARRQAVRRNVDLAEAHALLVEVVEVHSYLGKRSSVERPDGARGGGSCGLTLCGPAETKSSRRRAGVKGVCGWLAALTQP